MTNQQLLVWGVVPIVLSQITTIVVLIFGFVSNNRRLDDVITRLTRIEGLLTEHDRRITRLEERTPPLVYPR